MSITKKIRFEVFKRDGFVCQYCGNHPPLVVLEVDHINPKSRGGEDDINNLITSCFDCNRGKSNYELSKIPSSLIANKEALIEKELQYKEYRKVVEKINKRIFEETRKVEIIFSATFIDYEFTESFRMNSVRKFIEKIGLDSVVYAMTIACEKFEKSGTSKNPKTRKWEQPKDMALSYFCGICWNKIKNHEC